MTRPRVYLAVTALICAAVFGSAFAFAPLSCEGGLGVYFWVGIAAIVSLLAVPFIARFGGSLLAALGWSAGLAVIGVVAWIGGFAAAPFRILCRLF